MIRTAAVLVALALGRAVMLPADAVARNQAGADVPPPDTLAEARSFARAPEPAGYRFPSGRNQLEDWALNAFGPTAVAGSLTSAGWGQWVIDEPPEWTGDGRGFARRLGASSATTAITETSVSLLSALARQDFRYHRCPCTGFGPRVTHAIKMTFLSRRPDGRAVFSVPKTVSPFAGPMVTRNTLYPDRYTPWDAALSGGYAVLMNAGWNLAREFVLSAPEW